VSVCQAQNFVQTFFYSHTFAIEVASLADCVSTNGNRQKKQQPFCVFLRQDLIMRGSLIFIHRD
jgi:hypothetical protein